ncbi:MAG: sulfite exporter TauE/SafE family protein [Corynebacteriales bacterium]|nr:sulfite exporter TauE/SafE family protein [Mycobacteriales bacterium]
MSTKGEWKTDVGLGPVVGVFSGLFGVGGGVIAVPAFRLLAKMEPKPAHATSLVAVCVIASAGAASFAAGGEVHWGAAAALAAGGAAGSQLGALILRKVTGKQLTIAFGIFLLGVAAWFLSGAATESVGWTLGGLVDALIYLAVGVGAGTLSAFMGVGGGVIMIPALVLVGGFDQHLAEGTSLAAMVPISLIGAARLTKDKYPDWGRGVRVGIAGALLAPVGAFLAMKLDAVMLQRLFALCITAVAIQLIYSTMRKPKPEKA